MAPKVTQNQFPASFLHLKDILACLISAAARVPEKRTTRVLHARKNIVILNSKK
jgi:hypothetical protein